MSKNQYRVLSIGAHPDDADTYAGGLLWKFKDSGWGIRLLSITDGGAGSFDPDMTREHLASVRRKEATNSGLLLGGRYDVFSHKDGGLEPTLAVREELIRYIRTYKPDVILTNRTCDYHADHRNVSQLLQDSAYLLTIPLVCEDTPYLEKIPTILFWGDGFKRQRPFQTDFIVPLTKEQVKKKASLACCHESQYFSWMYWPEQMEKISWPREKQIEDLENRYLRSTKSSRDKVEERLVEKYGAETAAKIGYVELLEVSEYGGYPFADLISVIERVD